ncbi:MAG: ZIP family metal transporter [Cellulosilyticum sp.]|nr:ZIP family metal transporter [Cellulosilyticum sp.]
MEIVNTGLMGLIAEGGGLSIGIIALYFFKIKSGRNMGMLYGATSGLMLAMICFDVLPEALSQGRMDLVFCGIIIGTLLGIGLDDLAEGVEKKCEHLHLKNIGRTGLILALGIAIHNIPEGFALGTIAHTSADSISRFAIILALHSIPEGIAMAIPFKKANTSLGILLIVAFCLGIMMGIGAILGYTLSGISDNLISTGLGIAGGIILYIVCGELIPQSRKIWNGRWTTIATILGLMGGILLLQH